MDRIFWQRQVHSGADAEVGIRDVNALQLDYVQHILGRQVRPLEEKRTAVPAGKLKKSPGFCAVPEEVRVIKKSRENWMNFTGKRECGQSRLCSKSVKATPHNSRLAA